MDDIKIFMNGEEYKFNNELYEIIKSSYKIENIPNKFPIQKNIRISKDSFTNCLEQRIPGKLILSNGKEFNGYSFGYQSSISGEVVFNTGMVGYPESLTDPSYYGQILVLTYPSIGNYGVPPMTYDDNQLLKYFESNSIKISGLIISNYSQQGSHWNSNLSLSDWLINNKIPAIYDIDTRELTKTIRNDGLMLGKMLINNDDNESIEWYNPNNENLVSYISVKKPYVLNQQYDNTIIIVDCGIKYNIIRQFLKYPVKLLIVPWNYDFSKETMDGLFISNGPGDPLFCKETISNIKKIITHQPNIPIFAICLGHQLLSLAIGAKTQKLKFGNRSLNQPCIDIRTSRCHITPQNHSFAVNENTLPEGWKPLFFNANDNSNEGMIHEYLPYISVQFHPEAKGGPSDTEFLFDTFISNVKKNYTNIIREIPLRMPQKKYSKVLILGSGGLSIGQAGEFDYSGSQAIKALKEYNIKTVLINPNIATVQTSENMVDRLYFYPVNKKHIIEVIKKEKPDGILITFGGQTALNAAIDLYRDNIFELYNIDVIGTSIETIIMTENRVKFSEEMSTINEPTSKSVSVNNIEDALIAAKKIGYPIMIREGFALGGLGSCFVNNDEDLKKKLETIFISNNNYILIEKSIKGWKEVEYEVVRDQYDNCITICNMENFDPIGVHTGDSIVIAPSQTLSNDDYYMLRSASIKIIRHLKIIGECNVQFALNPYSSEYCVIEVNARLSRSSALASKATGYPLAYIAAKLGLGENLSSIKNNVTKTTTACYEPSLDYLVVKIPRWDLKKFNNVNNKIGSAMMSVGEIMAIGRNFEETIQKAIRMVDDSKQGFEPINITDEEIDDILLNPCPDRIYAIATAYLRGYSVQKVNELTKIDYWFLDKLYNITNVQNAVKNYQINTIPISLLTESKKKGFSDNYLGQLLNCTENEIRNLRTLNNIRPTIKKIDTTAGEFPAETNYLYCTYNGNTHDVDFNNNGIIVLGCGVYRIGSSVEFDWCAVSCIRTLKKNNKYTIVINYNPETVSTDYDESDRLYFDEISLERVLDIYQLESSQGVIVSVGGQTANNICLDLYKNNVNILGTNPQNIDRAEDRYKFSQLLDSINVDQPEWDQLTNLESAKLFCNQVKYPCLIRPSYVLSGAAMKVVSNHQELEDYLTNKTTVISNEYPVVISKFMEDNKEIEIDAVADKGKLICYAISEHVENAGVHSGDATLILPAQKLYLETVRRIKKISHLIAKNLEISGPFNIQFLSKDNHIKVIECNLRASRSFPFVSKCFRVNFIDISTNIMINQKYDTPEIKIYDIEHVCVKVPMFSFNRLPNSDPVLGVDMSSTGEVASFGENVKDAYLSAMISSGFKVPQENILIIVESYEIIYEFLKDIKKLTDKSYKIYTNIDTGRVLNDNNINNFNLQDPDIINNIRTGNIEMVIYIPTDKKGFDIRRCAVDYNIPIITNIKTAKLMIASLCNYTKKNLLCWSDFDFN